MNFLKKYWLAFVLAILLILGYEALVSTKVLANYMFYSLTTVPETISKNWSVMQTGLFSSLSMLGTAYIMAVIAGILIGSLVGLKKIVRHTLSPFITFLSAIPVTLITYYALNILPSFWAASVFVIFLGCFWIILSSTIAAVHTIDKRYLENSATLEVNGVERFFRIVLPAASPGILSGCSIALTLAFYMLAVAETFGATSGLGYFVMTNSELGNWEKTLAGLVFIAIVLGIIMIIFDLIKARILHWTMNN